MFRSIANTFVVAALLAGNAFAAEMIWDGGDGFWNDENWNNGFLPSAVVGRSDGTRGSEDAIIIGDGNILYNADEVGSDFQMRQGNTLTISGGASWTQLTEPAWSENRWTEMDLSELILDNGFFNRIGSKPGEGGGALIFGSWRGDDNFDIIPPPEEINITISNGGGIQNEGQLWLGGWEDHPPGLIVNLTINDGFLDLTGGTVPDVGDEADADLGIFFGFDDNAGEPKNEDYNINFTGPGSITVDSSGIIAPFKLDLGGGNAVWTNLDPIEYEDLWDAGVLQADGISGTDGAIFDEFFSVEGALGSDDYKLVSLVGETTIPGDVNMDGQVDAADLNIVGINWQMTGRTPEQGDLTGDGIVNAADLNILGINWQTGVPAAAAVPEPSCMTLLLIALLAGIGSRRPRRT